MGAYPRKDVLMTMEAKERRPRRSFSKEFKAEVVELVRTSGQTVGAVARRMDLTETAVRDWVRQADIDAGKRDGLTTAEREELAALRKDNRILREERDILKRAVSFFAREAR
jgi:transposase